VSPTLVYLYAVTTAAGARAVGKVTGIEGLAVRAIEQGGTAALVSDVPAAAYEQSVIDEAVRDGEWLTPRAKDHQDVNAAAHAAAEAVLPVPFATIYRSDERVREMLRERGAELNAKLASVRGSAEWVVGVYRDTVRAAEHLAQVADALAHRAPVTAGEGRRYLERKSDEGQRRDQLRRLDAEAAQAARHAIERVSRHSFEEPVVDEEGDLVARTTYLVRRSDEERLGHAAEGFNADWRERGFELRLTGPWPPYRTSGASL